MNEASAIQPEDLLDSWKDIAAYLKRDISTVQRWERREDMPVHRHVHDRRGSVYAFRSELDVWLDSRRRRLEQEADQGTAETAESLVPAFNHQEPVGRRWLLAGAMTAVVAAATTYLLLSDRVATTRAVSVRSLAVLPLQNLSADPAQDFFVDGMTEALIGRLSRIPGIRVISRTSAMHLRARAYRFRKLRGRCTSTPSSRGRSCAPAVGCGSRYSSSAPRPMTTSGLAATIASFGTC